MHDSSDTHTWSDGIIEGQVEFFHAGSSSSCSEGGCSFWRVDFFLLDRGRGYVRVKGELAYPYLFCEALNTLLKDCDIGF